MENRRNPPALEGRNIHAEDRSLHTETPPPIYEDACYICRMSMAPLLSNSVHTSTQDQLVITNNTSSTHPTRFEAEQETTLSQYQRLTRILRTEHRIKIPCVYQETTK